MNLLKSLGEYFLNEEYINTQTSGRIYRETAKSLEVETPYIVYSCNKKQKNDPNLTAQNISEIDIKLIGDYEQQDDIEIIREYIKSLLVGKCGNLTLEWYGKIIFKSEFDEYDKVLRQKVAGITLLFLEF